MDIIRVLSCDPGTKNSAIFVADFTVVDGKLKGVKLIASFMMTVTRTEPTRESRKDFEKYIKLLKKKYRPDALVIERFQPRGGFLKGSIIECVNWMICTMQTIFDVPDERLLTAASWKNIVTKRGKIDLKALYKEHKIIGPHRLDALLMSLISFGFDPKKIKKFVRFIYPQLIKL